MSTRRPARRSLAVLLVTSALAGAPTTEASAASLWTVSVVTGSNAFGDAGTLAAPTGVVATCAGGRTVRVTWGAVSDAATYTIQQSTQSATGTWSNAATGQTGTSWTSGNLTNGSTYWFRVRSIRGSWTANSTGSQGRAISGGVCS